MDTKTTLEAFRDSPQEWCKFSLKARAAKVRKVHILVTGGVVKSYGVHNNNLQNSWRAVMERVFYVSDGKGGFGKPVVPDTKYVTQTLGKFRSQLLALTASTLPVSRQTFVNYYRGRKRKNYQRAADDLNIREVSRQDAYLSSFLKAEKINFTDKKDPAPRLIQPRTPRYNVEVGCYLKPLEHRLYKSIDKIFGETTVAKGLNADERGQLLYRKWKGFTNPVAIFLDASRFDQHVSAPVLRWEHSIYKSIYDNCKMLAKLLSWQVDNVGFINTKDGRIKYRTQGKRGSGDMNTACGNVLIMCALLDTYAKQRNCRVSVLNDGDDSVVIVEKQNFNIFQQDAVTWFSTLGFKMKLEGFTDVFERIQFCQSQPVLCPNGKYRMVRDPRLSIDKDNINVKNVISEKAWNNTRSAIAGCGLALTGDLPILSKYYQMLTRGTTPKTSDVLESGMDYLARGMEMKISEPNDATRFSFYKAFNFSPDEQTAIEESYDTITPKYSPLGSPFECYKRHKLQT